MTTNTEWLNKYLWLLIAALSATPSLTAHASDKTECPADGGTKTNTLVTAHLFDGDVSENAELVPDNEKSAAWAISGYKDSGRSMHLVCDYKDGTHKDLTVTMPAEHCYVKGRKQVKAWCGR